MKIFKAIRFSIWSILIALCVSVVVLNYSLATVTNNPAALQQIARSGGTYDILRRDILTPRIRAEVQAAGYGELIDRQLIQHAVDAAFSDRALDTLLVPATQSLSNWLGSKQPDPSFTVDAKRQLGTLADTLGAQISTKLMSQPVCTWRSTETDVATGTCHLPTLTRQSAQQEIVAALRSQPTITSGVISSSQITIPSSIAAKTRDIPEYLNMLNSANIFGAGILALSALWLLFKHRLRGIAVIGIGGLLAALFLYIAQSSLLGAVNSYALEAGYQELTRALAQSAAAQLRSTLLPLVAVSAALTLAGWGGWYVLRRRHSAQRKRAHVQFGNSTSDIDDINT